MFTLGRTGKEETRAYFFLGFVLALGVLLRFLSPLGELWLDEIWSLQLVAEAQSLMQLLFGTPIDNNHLLNSLYLYFAQLSGLENAYWLRALSLGSGLLALYIFFLFPWPKGSISKVVAVTLFSISYPLILYSGEARGYSLAVFFSLAAVWAQEAYLQKNRAISLGAVWLAVLLGLLSHFTFFHIYAALFIFSFAEILSQKSRISFRRFLALHTPPCAFSMALYMGYILRLPPGTGPLGTYVETILETLSISFGGPLLSPLTPLSSLLVLGGIVFLLVLFVLGIRLQWKQQRRDIVFLVLVVFLVPALGLCLSQPRVLFPRYFLVCFPFLYILFGIAFEGIWKERRSWRPILLVFSVLVVSGSILHSWRLVSFGRAHYEQALRFISAYESQLGTTSTGIDICGDHLFRHSLMIDFYEQKEPHRKKAFRFCSDEEQRAAPSWYLRHTQDAEEALWPRTLIHEDHKYEKAVSYSAPALSGWHLALYRQR